MNTPLGRNGLIGLAVGATAGLGLIAFIIYKEISKRRSRRVVLEAHPAVRLFDGTDGAALLQEAMDAQGALARLGSAWLCLVPKTCTCFCQTLHFQSEDHLTLSLGPAGVTL